MKTSYLLVTLSRFNIQFLNEIISSDDFTKETKSLARRVLKVKLNP